MNIEEEEKWEVVVKKLYDKEEFRAKQHQHVFLGYTF